LAVTWNVDRARDYGTVIARDTRARGYFDILSPGMDFYRTPLAGRNFEYMTGEDPLIGATPVPVIINAIQEQGVWATAKHFVANDQETNRCSRAA
jgi:beta-glucosidase